MQDQMLRQNFDKNYSVPNLSEIVTVVSYIFIFLVGEGRWKIRNGGQKLKGRLKLANS